MRQVVASEVKNKGKIIKPSSVEIWSHSPTGGGPLREFTLTTTERLEK